jgi:hypothetical protein
MTFLRNEKPLNFYTVVGFGVEIFLEHKIISQIVRSLKVTKNKCCVYDTVNKKVKTYDFGKQT